MSRTGLEASSSAFILGKLKKPAFERSLLPEYQSDDIENCLVLLPICSVTHPALIGYSSPWIGKIFGKTPSENLQKPVKNDEKDFPWFSFLTIMTLNMDSCILYSWMNGISLKGYSHQWADLFILPKRITARPV